MTKLTTLKQKRAALIESLDRFVAFVSKYDNSQLEQLKFRVDVTQNYLDSFEEIQTQIECNNGGGDIIIETEERQSFENKYFESMSQAKVYIESSRAVTSTPTPNIDIISNRTVIEPNIKLPTLSLPSFSGSYSEWRNFRDTFRAIVNDNPTLTNAQKFYYLRVAVKGDALKAIEAIEVTDTNYQVALDILKERYENTKLLVNTHIRDIFEIPNIIKENGTQLRNLCDTVLRNIRCLKSLKLPTEHWDALLIYIVSRKLDKDTLRAWETAIQSQELPKFEEFMDFLKSRCQIIESLQSELKNIESKTNTRAVENKVWGRKSSFAGVTVSINKCAMCNEEHKIMQCAKFKEISVEERIDFVKKNNLCFNCLYNNHRVFQCKIKSSCQNCSKRHHTLLHIEGPTVKKCDVKSETEVTVCGTGISELNRGQILLATASVKISGPSKNYRICKILLDCGSMSNFITKKLCNTLKLPLRKVNTLVSGIGVGVSKSEYCVDVYIRSRLNNFEKRVTCLVLDKITEDLPMYSFDAGCLKLPQVELADNKFNESKEIDCLLGSDTFWECLGNEKILLGNGKPVLQSTIFGYIIVGGVTPMTESPAATFSYCVLSDSIEKFWKIEEFDTPQLSEDEQKCEEFFCKTFKRLSDGRFCVKIPLKENINTIGDSRTAALRRFYAIEKRLIKDTDLRNEYVKFMREYEFLGHMTKISLNQENSNLFLTYYLPHHAVMKEGSSTTRCRVIFDGSSKTDLGLCLNGVQLTGATVQSSLLSILLRFRKHKYVLNADIEKMYRQIWVDKNDRKFQIIFWRENPTEELNCYVLNTITYGLSSSPYLATRCLKQLAIENSNVYPIASKIIEETLKIKNELIHILNSAGFNLRKWASNEPGLLSSSEVKENQNLKMLPCGETNVNKTLGLLWDPNCDTLQYKVKNFENNDDITKRSILSDISKIFDPYGLLQPVIIKGKLLMQTLWKNKLDWDEPVNEEIRDYWLSFKEDLSNLNEIKIPRHALNENFVEIEMHGFCDASERAYGACVYIKTNDVNGICKVTLIYAKSKVAPIRNLTIARLELCGAVLLSKLMKTVHNALQLNVSRFYYWCDSMIVLHWIRADSNRWKTFVANRVAEIQTLTCKNDWRHVKGELNIADVISRGLRADQLKGLEAWWRGPKFIYGTIINQEELETELMTSELLPEEKVVTISSVANINWDIFDKYSSVSKLSRIIAWCFRFITNSDTTKFSMSGGLTVIEIQNAMMVLIRIAQLQSFPQEVRDLKKKKQVKKSSKLYSLIPFQDGNGIIRVGGRLQNSNLNYEGRHPIILSSNHKLTQLISKAEHVKQLHCGPQSLLFKLRQKYWVTNGRNLVRKICHECVICFKIKPRNVIPQMADLPAARVLPAAPFETCGVDYCGYFNLKDKRTRGCKILKCYVCVFVCFVTKAIHLELVTSLATETFIAALRRFVSRRGIPKTIWSDNATNFLGAKRELKELYNMLKNEESQREIQNYMLTNEIEWKNIAPRAAHMGGIWESAVKSFKYHFKRICQNANLVYEDFNTLLTQIEAVLNSRPLQPLTSDPTELNPLTPGHFLIGRPITSVVDRNLLRCKENLLGNYQRCQQLLQHFWQRWSKEHLSTLQQRPKWRETAGALDEGSLVIIKEDNMLPCQWLLGRVTKVHPGTDGVVRVVTLKTCRGEIKRPVIKLCPLPINGG